MSFGGDINRVEFRIKRVTFYRKQCPMCGGTGKRSQGYKEVPCGSCRNGVAEHEHHTEVSLLDALLELGLISRKAEQPEK